MEDFCDKIKIDRILDAGNTLDRERLNAIFQLKPRAEKVAVKDVKLRTFITRDSQRDDLAAHVYDLPMEVSVVVLII